MPGAQPEHVRLFEEGQCALEARDMVRAEASFRAAVTASPQFGEAYGNLGFVLDARGALEEAEGCYRRCLELLPNSAETHLNLGGLLLSQLRFAEAEEAFMQAIRCAPQRPGAWSNLGVLYASLKREADAERCYRVALELDPEHARTQFNLSYLLLRQGQCEEGFRRFEARAWYEAFEQQLACPRWRGEPVSGKRLLVCADAGHGDAIQCVRYLESLDAARITLLCQPALVSLLRSARGVSEVLGYGASIESSDWDYWTPLWSFPFYCQTRLETIPARLPYLFADAQRTQHWAAQLPTAALRVGLAWRGNPQFENDAQRSLPDLSSLATLADLPGVCFVSLQKGADEQAADDPPAGMTLINPARALQDFADTAALIMSLDLVISVDSAVAHLSAALGKPTWLLLPDYKPDWRWLKDRSDSPWYPQVMRLFRQSRRGDWSEPLEAVRAALGATAAACP